MDLVLAAGSAGTLCTAELAHLIHQPRFMEGYQATTDIDIMPAKSCACRSICNDIFVKHTGQPLEKVEREWNVTTSCPAE